MAGVLSQAKSGPFAGTLGVWACLVLCQGRSPFGLLLHLPQLLIQIWRGAVVTEELFGVKSDIQGRGSNRKRSVWILGDQPTGSVLGDSHRISFWFWGGHSMCVGSVQQPIPQL